MKKENNNLYSRFVKLPLVTKLIILIVFGVTIWFIGSKTLFKTSAKTQYTTAKVQKGTIIETVSSSGNVSSANITPVVTQVTGTITKIYVNNGDTVKAGSPIAEINLDQSSQQSYIQQLSSYENAKNSVASANAQKHTLKNAMVTAETTFVDQALNKRLSENNPKYIQYQETMKAAEDNYARQDSVITQAQTNLQSAALSLQQVSPTINAPITGKITGLAYQVGSVIPAQAKSATSTNQVSSQNIAYITTSSTPIVTVSLTEIDIPKIALGQKATVIFDALPDSTFTGKIVSINTTGTVSSGVTTYPVTIYLDTGNDQIYANMSATANIIITAKDNVLYVPTSAVVTQNNQTMVRELKNDVVEYIPVTTGISSDTQQEITSGVNEGDEVITAIITPSGTSGTTTTSPFGIRTGGFGGGGVRNPGR